MSDNIPFEIQTEIVQRIPDTKSLIRFRSVSKAWKSVIDSQEFVTAHTLRHHQAHNRHHLLVRKEDSQVKYVSIVDDDTFPNQKHNVCVPDSVKKLSRYSNIVGSSHGLFCLYDNETSTAVIWNPSIRRTIFTKVPKPMVRRPDYRTVVGFGICPGILDPKLVKITYPSDLGRLQDDENISTLVEVYTLSSGGTWRSPLSSNLPHKSIGFGYFGVAIDGFIYWVASDRSNVRDGYGHHSLIMSFDLISEEFTKVNLPFPLALNYLSDSSISNLRESLAIFKFDIYTVRRRCNVWMMIGHGSTRSFNKLYSIDAPDASIVATLGFRKNGTPIVAVENDKEDYRVSATYEQESNRITNIGIYGMGGFFFLHSYMETLLLLGH